MANYSRRADGLVELEGAPAPLALTDDQLASLGHVPAPLRGLPPGALATNDGAGGAPGAAPGNTPEAKTDAGGGKWDPSMGGAPGFVHNPNAGTGTQSSVDNELPDTPMSATDPKTGEFKKPAGTTTDLPDKPRAPQKPPATGGGSKLISKGGLQLAGYKQETGIPLTDQQIDEAVGLKRAEQEANEEAQALGIRREADTVKKQADQLAFQHARLAGEREKRKAIDESILEAQNTMQSRENELSQMPAPKMKDYWEDKGILGRIGSVLALVSGGALQGLQGRADNPGQTMLNGIYEQWAGEKREQYERAKDDAARAKTRYGQLIQLYGTPEEADKALRAEAAQVAGMQIENYAQMMKTPEQVAQLRALQAQNGQERIKLKAELLKAREGRVEKTFVNAPPQYSGGKRQPKGVDRMVRLPGGGYGWARDATVARAAQKAIKANTRIKALSSELRALTKSVGNRSPTAEERARAETIASELKFTAKEAFEAGALDQGLLTEMNNYLGDPTALFSITDTDSKLDQVGRIADGKISEIYEYDLMADPEGTTPLVQDVAPAGVEAR